jgi:hypothetical protein
MWGNNDGAIKTTTETELICAPEKTIGRTWKIVENGNVGAVEIRINQSAIIKSGVTEPGLDSSLIIVLKVADDKDFTNNVSYVPLNINEIDGEDVYETSYDFNGTQYFTYSEINGIFWTGAAGDEGEWKGGSGNDNNPTTNDADKNKVMVIDAQGTDNNPILTEDAVVECVWIKEGSKLMVESDNYLEFDEDFILDGELRLVGEAQLIQTHIGASNVEGTGKLYRDQTATVPNVYRYHYWSSPVRELNSATYRLGQVLFDGTTPTSENSEAKPITWTGGYDGATTDPITMSRYWTYSYLDGDSANAWIQKFETGSIQRGQGFLLKSTGRTTTDTNGVIDGNQNFTFAGTPNDGSIIFNFSPNKSSLLGNPYPSTLDANQFIETNINSIYGTLYFWEHNGENGNDGIEGHTFAGYQGGYSQRNASMGIAANQTGNNLLFFDWRNATVTNGEVEETSDNFTAKVTSKTNENLNNLKLEGTNNIIIKNDELAAISQEIKITFSPSIDIASLFLLNDDAGTINLTISGGGSNSEDVVNLNSNGQNIELGWRGISSLTIESNPNTTAYKLGIGKIQFEDPDRPSLGDDEYTEPSRYIPVAQGFFVTGSPSGGEVRFDNDQRAYNDSSIFLREGSKKRDAQDSSGEIPIIKLGLNYVSPFQENLHRQIGVSFKRGNTFGYDNGYDSEIFDIQSTDFYWNFADYFNQNLIIAGVGEISNTLEVPITIVKSNNETVSIELDEIKNIDQEVFIEDKVTGSFYTLNENSRIELNLEEGTYKDRFFLTFNQRVLNVEDSPILDTGLSLFMDNDTNELVIKNNNTIIISKVAVFNLLGQQVKSWKNIENTTENRLKLNKLSSTIYVVRILTPKGSFSKKIMID